MKTVRPSREIFDKLADSPYPAFAFVAGVKLDVFTPLGDGPKTAEQLATVLDVDSRKLSPLLYALVVAGVLVVEDGAFANTPESDHYLVKGREEYIGNLCEAFEKRWRWALRTTESIRMGKPQAAHDYAAMSGAERDAFFRDLHPNALEAGRMLADKLNLAERRHLVDVGGGSGGLAIAGLRTVSGAARHGDRASVHHPHSGNHRRRIGVVETHRGDGARRGRGSASDPLRCRGIPGRSPGAGA